MRTFIRLYWTMIIETRRVSYNIYTIHRTKICNISHFSINVWIKKNTHTNTKKQSSLNRNQWKRNFFWIKKCILWSFTDTAHKHTIRQHLNFRLSDFSLLSKMKINIFSRQKYLSSQIYLLLTISAIFKTHKSHSSPSRETDIPKIH